MGKGHRVGKNQMWRSKQADKPNPKDIQGFPTQSKNKENSTTARKIHKSRNITER